MSLTAPGFSFSFGGVSLDAPAPKPADLTRWIRPLVHDADEGTRAGQKVEARLVEQAGLFDEPTFCALLPDGTILPPSDYRETSAPEVQESLFG